MADDERKDREDRAWEAMIIASYLKGDNGPDSCDDPSILSEEDRGVIDAMGPDVVDRIAAAIVAEEIPAAPNPSAGTDCFNDFLGIEVSGGTGISGMGSEIFALHRGDEQLTPEAIEEMNQRVEELLRSDKEERQGT
jgi:hypothetical protein